MRAIAFARVGGVQRIAPLYQHRAENVHLNLPSPKFGRVYEMLTERQRSVLDFIQREQREKGITPSTREIQNHFGFASQTSAMQYIAALERKGFLDRHARKARCVDHSGHEGQDYGYSDLRADPGRHVGIDRADC